MTVKQLLLKKAYPLLMKVSGKKASVVVNEHNRQPLQSFYTLTTTLANGTELHFETLRHKKILLVNTASDCGYTAQYDELQQLYQQYGNGLLIIAFPANDFKEQEKGSNEDIASFCRVNYGVTFPVAAKSVVVKGSDQNEVFQWLTSKEKNGWNNKPPSWNFSKYLVNEQGVLTHYFDPAISPMSTEVLQAIQL